MKSLSFFLFLVLLAIMPGCGEEETVVNTQTFPLSPEFQMNPDQAAMLLQNLDPMNGSQVAAPAEGTNPGEIREIPRSYFTQRPVQHGVRHDVLKELNITIVNEFDEGLGITEASIRGIADAAYARTGILDTVSLQGWTLTVRTSSQGPGTAHARLFEKQKRAVIEIDPVVFTKTGPHEMAHILAGRVLYEKKLPAFMYEFLSIGAEDSSEGLDIGEMKFVYDQVNRPILGLGKTIDNEDSVIHAQNSPFDGFRYDLLRAGKKKIGDEKYRELVRRVFKMGLESADQVTLDELQPVFAEYGLGDLVLFQKTKAPGIYVDLVFTGDGLPLVLTKQINDRGFESSFITNFQMALKKDGTTMWMMQGTTNPGGVVTDPGLQFQPWFADQIDILVGTTTYTYKIVDDVEK